MKTQNNKSVKPHILFVDDDSGNLELFKIKFHKHYEIHCANSAKDAISILKKAGIQVLVTDQLMPDMTGVELLEYTSENYPDVMRIILSAYSDSEFVIDAINKGKIQSYLLKSRNTDEIRIAIQNALETWNLKEKNKKLINDLSWANKELKQKTRLLEKDIRQRKETEKKLKISERSYKELVEETRMGIICLDSDGEITFVNNRFRQLFGYTGDEMKQITFRDLIHPDDFNRIWGYHNNWISAVKASSKYEFRGIRKNGSEIFLAAHARRLRKDQEYNGVRFYFRDISEEYKAREELIKYRTHLEHLVKERTIELEKEISERIQAEEAIRASEEKFRLTFEKASIGKALIKPDGKISKVNKALCGLLGYSAAELESIDFDEITHPEDLAASQECSRSLLAGEKDTSRFEKRFLRKNGKIVWTHVNTILLRDEKGEPLNFITHVIDITDRKRTETAFHESDKRYRTLMENIPGAVYRCNLDEHWTMLYMSDAIHSISGYPASDFISNSKRTFASIIYPEDQEMVAATVQKALNDNGKYEMEYRIVHKNSSIVWVYEKGQIIIDPEGKVDFLDGIIIDINAMKKAQQELDTERVLLKTFMDNVPDNIYFKDTESRILRANKAIVRHFGLQTEDELIGKTDFDFFSKEHAQQAYSDEQEIIKTGEFVKKEEKETWPDGRISWASTIKLPLVNNGGEVIGTFGISRDITDKKKAEETLKLNEERLSSLLYLNQMQEASEEKIIDYALEQAVMLTNSKIGYLHFLDEDQQSIKLTKWTAATLEDYEAEKTDSYPLEQESIWADSLRTRKPVIHNDYQHATGKKEYPEGHIPVIRHISVPVIEKDQVVIIAGVGNKEEEYDETDVNQLSLFMNDMWDILIKKRWAKELEVAKEAADAANRAKSEFLANMSHEIRTPMNAVLGYAELLTPMITDKNQKDYLQAIKSSGTSLLTLINDILDLSKIEAGKLELQFEYVGTQSIFHDMEHVFSLKITEKGLNFIVDISSSTPAAIYVDEIRLRQILLNLLGNAVKFTEKGHVKLSVWCENPQTTKFRTGKIEEYIDLVIEIADTGIGISKEYQERIFESFQQQDSVSTKKFGGTGLGLTITKKLVELMNGTITLSSELNKGSAFKVVIPDVAFLRDYEKSDQELFIDPENVIFREATVIIVDDIEHNRKLIIDTLRNTDLQTIEAENGEVAYNLARKTKPDLIIADIRMPVMDGFELLEKLKKNKSTKHIPVLAYSASVMKLQKERIMNSDFAGLLIKPVHTTDLYRELMNNLSHSNIQDAEDSGAAKEEIPKDDIENLSELLEKLETDLYQTWESFSKRQPLDEVRKLGEELSDLGKNHKATALNRYGKELIHATDDFNIQKTLRLLKEYPKLVESLKKFN